jgi:hypothetical protein
MFGMFLEVSVLGSMAALGIVVGGRHMGGLPSGLAPSDVLALQRERWGLHERGFPSGESAGEAFFFRLGSGKSAFEVETIGGRTYLSKYIHKRPKGRSLVWRLPLREASSWEPGSGTLSRIISMMGKSPSGKETRAEAVDLGVVGPMVQVRFATMAGPPALMIDYIQASGAIHEDTPAFYPKFPSNIEYSTVGIPIGAREWAEIRTRRERRVHKSPTLRFIGLLSGAPPSNWIGVLPQSYN